MTNPRRQRVMIIGQPGAGKSTLARKLGDLLELPVIHIDKIHWQSGWVARSTAEKGRLCREVHAQPQWIFEGGHSKTWPERLSRADTLIWLNFPLRIRAWRVFLRTIKYHGESRPDLPGNCPERFNREFTHWIWSTRNTGRIKMQTQFESASAQKEKYQLCNRRQVDQLLSSFAQEANRPNDSQAKTKTTAT